MDATSEPARLHVVSRSDVTHVTFPRQKIDGVAVRELYELAMALTDRPHPKLLIDLHGVPMVSSGAIGIFLAIHKKYLSHGGKVHLAVADPLVVQSMQVMNVHRILRLFEAAEAAETAFR